MVYAIALLIFLCIVIVVYMVYCAHRDVIDYRKIQMNNPASSSSDLKIFFISDLHARNMKKETLEQIKDKIDFVIVGGDLTEPGVPLSRVKENLRLLKEWQAPIYFIWGNNDYDANYHELENLLMSENVNILRNSSSIFQSNKGDSIQIIGLDCCNRREANLDLALDGIGNGFKLLVTHDPSAIYQVPDEQLNAIDLVLSGHTHGGQIRIFGFGFYKRGGLKPYKGTKLLISEGYGYTKLPFRLGTNAECHVITLEKN